MPVPARLMLILFATASALAQATTPAAWADVEHSMIGEAVVVATNDGRTFEGRLSTVSTPEEWTLIHENGGLRSTTIIPTGNIVGAKPSRQAIAVVGESRGALSATNKIPSAGLVTTDRIQWIETLANWRNMDQDSFPDGLEIRVTGFSRNGQSIPLRGTIDARLIGIVPSKNQRTQPGFGQPIHQYPVHDGRPPRLKQLERWSLPITSEHQQGTELVFFLPVRNQQTCQQCFPWTRLKVRLNVPGQGSWDAETSVSMDQADPFNEQWLIQQHRWNLALPTFPR